MKRMKGRPCVGVSASRAGLEMMAALLQVHHQAAEVADEVRGGAEWETVGLWVCVCERGSE